MLGVVVATDAEWAGGGGGAAWVDADEEEALAFFSISRAADMVWLDSKRDTLNGREEEQT